MFERNEIQDIMPHANKNQIQENLDFYHEIFIKYKTQFLELFQKLYVVLTS